MYHVSTARTQHVVASHSRDQASVVLLWGSRKQYQFSARHEVVREPLMKAENDGQNFVHISCSFLTTVYAASVHVKKVLHISRRDWIPLGTSLVTESPLRTSLVTESPLRTSLVMDLNLVTNVICNQFPASACTAIMPPLL